MRGWRWGLPTAAAALLAAAVTVGASTRVEGDARPCALLTWDDLPWIVPPDRLGNRLAGLCDAATAPVSERRGRFEAWPEAAPGDLDGPWRAMDDTFPCNLARFAPDHLARPAPGAFALRLDADPAVPADDLPGGALPADAPRPYRGAGLETDPDRWPGLRYGRVEATLRAARGSGLVTALFLYRFDPWQEIDLEILGRDPTRLLVNVYENPGEAGDTYNYGYRGTPATVDLGFDASAAEHRYAVEWDPGGMRWFVDGRLVHARAAGLPTPVPHLPMRIYANLWASCSEELAGPVDPAALPATATVRDLAVARWRPSLPDRLHDWFRRLVLGPDWRDRARWMRPRAG